ncbi:MAG: GAF domain-containing protein [Acidimicrobiia bacterium]|nr:GAF domain-containing protein [Acidimicrobiia bacterium]
MIEQRQFLEYRLNVVRLGQALSVVGFIALTIHLLGDGTLADPDVRTPVVALGLALVGAIFAPWRTLLLTFWGDIGLLVWAGAMAGGLLVADSVAADDVLAIAFLAIVVFTAAALANPIITSATAVVSLVCYFLVVQGQSFEAFTANNISRVGAFATAAALLLVAATGIRKQMRTTAQRLENLVARDVELTEREGELQHLYDVSRTIGTGTDLSDVLPEIVGRVVAAIQARTGVVMIYRSEAEALEVLSPIWVAGHTLRAEGYMLPLVEGGINQRVFTSGEPSIVKNLAEEESRAQFLIDLDAGQVLSVPLRIEARIIGVLMIADKHDGDFTEEDVTALEGLAGPSALVLNQMMRYQEARDEGEKMAELAKLKTDFVSTVSHELRTPLTSIIGSLRTLQRPQLAPPDPNAQQLLSTAHRQANRLRSLIEDLLVVSRIDNQALPMRPQLVELETFLADTVQGVPDVQDGMVNLDIEPEANYLRCDPDHLGRIIMNLLYNAVKYAPESPVEIWARQRRGEVWLSVIDHGPGIPYELHDHIFDRFTQVAGHATRSKGGTGLGLSIVRGLTEAMGGRVWFEPTIGGGATFTVGLPARTTTAQDHIQLQVPDVELESEKSA